MVVFFNGQFFFKPLGDLLFLTVLEVLGLYPVGLVESQYQLPYWDSIESVLLRLRMSLNIVGLMGLNIRSLVESQLEPIY